MPPISLVLATRSAEYVGGLEDVFTLLDDFERELATPDGADRPARPAPRGS